MAVEKRHARSPLLWLHLINAEASFISPPPHPCVARLAALQGLICQLNSLLVFFPDCWITYMISSPPPESVCVPVFSPPSYFGDDVLKVDFDCHWQRILFDHARLRFGAPYKVNVAPPLFYHHVR